MIGANAPIIPSRNEARLCAAKFDRRDTPPPTPFSTAVNRPRGEAIEKQLGQNLPQNFDVIDRFDNGIATSIKSVDLKAATYQNIDSLKTLLRGFVDQVKNFSGASRARVTITEAQIQQRAVRVGVPPGGSAQQWNALREIYYEAVQDAIDITYYVVQ